MESKAELLEYEDELLAALQKEYSNNDIDEGDEPTTITLPEVRERLGVSRRAGQRLLNRLCDEGKFVRKMVFRVNAWGHRTRKPGYKLVEK